MHDLGSCLSLLPDHHRRPGGTDGACSVPFNSASLVPTPAPTPISSSGLIPHPPHLPLHPWSYVSNQGPPWDFPNSSAGKESTCNAGDTGDVGSILSSERSPGGRCGNPLQYSLPEKFHGQGLPWRLSDKESICQCRRHRFDPWSRKIPHAAEHLNLCVTAIEPESRAIEPQLLSTLLQLLKSAHPRACAPQQEKPQQWNICALQLEERPHSSKDPTQPKINKITKNIQWTEEPGGLQSMGSQRIRHDWTTKHSTQCPSVSFFMAFVLKSILSHISMAAITFLSFLFAWNISWFVICVSFILKWVSGRQHVVGCCFIMQSAIICLLSRAFSPLIFKVIFYKYAFIAI